MKNCFLYFLLSLLILGITQSCGPSARLYRYDDKDKAYAGKLTDSVYMGLKAYLSSTTGQTVQDTIIIKYDYNHETCWDMLDLRPDDYIMSFIASNKQRKERIQKARPQVSLFNFREPGNKLNKIKKWDHSIIVDSSQQLLNRLFKERCTCGNSILVMPDQQYVFIRSDSHAEIFDLPQSRIEELLRGRQRKIPE